MFLMQLTKIDLRGIFEQGFRLVFFLILLINYLLLFFMHFFMVRPLYSICGHKYFSVISRWLFISNKPSNMSSAYWEIKTCCYFTNILDVTIVGFALMFLVSAAVEFCLSHGTKRKLQRLETNSDAAAPVTMSTAVLRQRITKKDAFRRLIFRMSISLVTAVFATINFASIISVFLMYNLVQTTISETMRQMFHAEIFALKWQIIMYLFLSFFFCGLLWSVQGIYRSQLQAINDRIKRLERFKKMNTEARSIVT